jgi:putative SOS response-associated peptidase YedK
MPFGMAGIWSMWKNKAGDYVPTVAVITSEPNEAMEEIRERQPVILEPRDYAEWLAPTDRPPVHLLRILPADEMNIELLEAHHMQLALNSQ